MWAVISAGMRYLAGLIFSAGAIKALAMGAVFFILQAVVSIVLGLIDQGGPGSLGNLTSQLPNDVLFYLNVFRIDLAITMAIAAYATRFAIRRIPVIG